MAKPFRYGELHIVVNNYTGVEGVRLLSANSKTEDVPIQLYARLFPLIQNFQREVAEELKGIEPATGGTAQASLNV
ncbi:MAG: hypothetical protein H8D67_24290 [Deltaproteobacteria bacterium]|nr:hypothetical protein [Deltaproteobacteria bacterium]